MGKDDPANSAPGQPQGGSHSGSPALGTGWGPVAAGDCCGHLKYIPRFSDILAKGWSQFPPSECGLHSVTRF